MSLINDAFRDVHGCQDPGKKVDRFRKSYPNFWSKAVEEVPAGQRTWSRVRPEFVDKFRRLAEQYARGGSWGRRYRGDSFMSSFPELFF
jgi:hypothetical protein